MSVPATESNPRVFKKGEVVAVRGVDDDFFLCRVLQHVFKKLANVRVWWLEEIDGGGGGSRSLFKFGGIQTIPAEAIMMPVKLFKADKTHYELPEKERSEIVDTLDRSIMGRGFSDDEDDDGDEDDEEDEGVVVNGRGTKRKQVKQTSPGAKRKPASQRKKTTPKKKTAPKGKKVGMKVKQEKPVKRERNRIEKKGKKKAEKATKAKRPLKEKKLRKGELRIRENVKVMDRDPFFHSTTAHPYVSANVEAKLIFRALNLRDNALLKKIVKNVKEVPSIYSAISQSVNVTDTAIEKAFFTRNVDALKILKEQKAIDDQQTKTSKAKKQERPEPTPCQLLTQGTGKYNFKSLGHAVRTIQISRGSREGNNALTRDQSLTDNFYGSDIEARIRDRASALAQSDATWEECKKFSPIIGKLDTLELHDFVERGNSEVAFHLADMSVQSGGFGLSKLFRDVLIYPGYFKASTLANTRKTDPKEEDPVLGPKAVLRHASVVKKDYNRGVTPLHFACINPNPAYLVKLLSVSPDVNVMDKRRKRLLHYAAANSSSECLKLLLDRGASMDEVDAAGRTAMHYAALAGRPENIKVMVDFAKERFADHSDDFAKPTMAHSRFGIAGINRADRRSYAPIHLAVTNSHYKVVEILLVCGADAKKPLSASQNKVTPLMLACQRGDMEMVKLLHSKGGAKLDGRDKLRRSPLMHAVIDGHAAVASHLLRAGVQIDHVDSSGNSALLYAVAYGWYFCVKLLLDTGADINLANSWKIPPLGIAFLKGHMGLFEFLLDASKDVDINFRDLEGATLIMSVLKNSDPKLAWKQLEYLVKEKNADCSLLDVKGNSPLHYLCCNGGIVEKDDDLVGKLGSAGEPESESVVRRIALLLIDSGCVVDAANEDGVTPLTIAAQNGSVSLMRVLMDRGAALVSEHVAHEIRDKENNILHYLTQFDLRPDPRPHQRRDRRPYLEFLESFFAEAEKDVNGEDGERSRKASTAIEALKKMAKAKHGEGKTVMLKMMESISTVSDWTTGALADETLRELREVTFAIFCLLVKKLDLDIDERTTVTKAGGVEKPGDGVLHMISKCGSNNSEYVSRVLRWILSRNPEIEALSYGDGDRGQTALNVAVKKRRLWLAEILVDHGADPDFQQSGVEEPDFLARTHAIRAGDVDMVEWLLKVNADVEKRDEATLSYPLHACFEGSSSGIPKPEMVQLLVDNGADVNARDVERRRTPLHMAVNSTRGDTDESTDVLELLIASGADLFAVDARGRLPLHYAFVKCGKPGESKQFDPIEICTLLTSSMKYESLDVADSFGSTPLYYAAARGSVVSCMHLIKRRCRVNVRNSEGNTPLSVAVRNGHRNCVIHLTQSGADVNVKSFPFDKKASGEAKEEKKEKEKEIEMKWLPAVRHCIPEQKGTHVLIQLMKNNWQGELYLMLDVMEKWNLTFGDVVAFAFECGQINVALRILRKCTDDAFLRKTDADGRTLLHLLALSDASFGAMDATKIAVVEKLFGAGISPSAADKFGCSFFHYCVFNHSVEMAKHCLIKVEDPDVIRQIFAARTNALRQSVVTSVVWKLGAANGGENSAQTQAMNWIDTCVAYGGDLNAVAIFPEVKPTDFGEFSNKFDHPLYFTEGLIGGRGGGLDGSEGESVPAAECKLVEKTLLQIGIEMRSFAFVKKLLSLKSGKKALIDVNKPEPVNGVTPLMTAIANNQDEMVNLILDPDHTLDHEKEKQKEKESKSKDRRRLAAARRRVKGSGRNRDEEDSNDDEDDDEEDDDEEDDDEDDDEEDNEEEEKDEEEEEEESMEQDDDDSQDRKKEDEEEDEEEEGSDDDDDDPKGATSKSLFARRPARMKAEKEAAKPRRPAPVSIKSLVNLNAADNVGRTAAHYCVAPFQGATFKNIDILKTLHRNGLVIDASVLALAASASDGNAEMLAVMRKLEGVVESASTTTFGMGKSRGETGQLPDDPSSELSMEVDYRADSRAFLDSLLESRTSAPSVIAVDSVALPSDERPLSAVALEDETGIPYDFIGSKVDVGYGGPFGYGLFNYYKMQVIHQAGKDLYLLTTRWGRFGDEGKFQRTPFESKVAAVAEFKKIFKAKTKNDWDLVKENDFSAFINHPSKYRLFKHAFKPKPVFKETAFRFDAESQQLPPPRIRDGRIVRMMRDLTDPEVLSVALHQLTNASKSSSEHALLALGDADRGSLTKALRILNEIGTVLTEREKAAGYTTEESGGKEANEKSAQSLFRLSNEFFHLVPMKDIDENSLKPIENRRDFNEKFNLVKQLLDIHASALMLAASQLNAEKLHPFDYLFRAIDCKIRALEQNEQDAQFVLRYIYNSSENAKIHAIYKLERPGELERVVSKGISNHKLLFHGTGKENLLSILSRGLLIAPPEAAICGHAYGKGVYFADQFSKSRHYARGGRGPSYMFLCQVALGKSFTESSDDDRPPKGFDSRFVGARKEPNPIDSIALCTPGEPIMPLGNLVDAKNTQPMGRYRYWGPTESEYIIFGEDQIALRYLIRFS